MQRTEALRQAASLINGERDQQYGTPENNFRAIAAMWTGYLGILVEAHDVAALMTMVKLGRIRKDPKKADSWVDLAGYAACGAEVAHAE